MDKLKLNNPKNTKKLKILPPTMREKRRYLLLETSDKEKAEKAVMEYVGILGWAKANPQFIEQNKSSKPNNKLILSITHTSLDGVKAALELKDIKVSRVSGVINKLQQA